MKKIGELLKSARLGQKKTVSQLSLETRIKSEFIEYLEEERFDKLPELPIVLGFVKNIAEVLSLNKDQAVAILRRDYPPKKITINPKVEKKSRFQFGPKMFLAAFFAFVILVLGGYLYYQYRVFVSPPSLVVIAPQDNDTIQTKTTVVRGTTDSSASVRVNNQPANVDKDGNFTAEIDVIPATHDIEVKAESRSGKVTTIHRTIKVISQ